MSSQPHEPAVPNERTVALGQHRIEDGIAWWRNGAAIVEREPETRRRVYERAVNLVLSTLQDVPDVAHLVAAYYRVSEDRWAALRAACDLDTGMLPVNAGLVEDTAFARRFTELIAQQSGGPFPHRS